MNWVGTGMKPLTLALVLMMGGGVVAGAAAQSAAPKPQPRVRLDPVSRTAVPDRPREEVAAGVAPAVVMERYVVKEKGAVPAEPVAAPEATGPFTVTGGGYLWGRNVGAARVEIGLWKNVDVFEKDAKFKPQKTKEYFDFVRIKF
jgi:hypothetical protein